jgi:hypothetical protein
MLHCSSERRAIARGHAVKPSTGTHRHDAVAQCRIGFQPVFIRTISDAFRVCRGELGAVSGISLLCRTSLSNARSFARPRGRSRGFRLSFFPQGPWFEHPFLPRLSWIDGSTSDEANVAEFAAAEWVLPFLDCYPKLAVGPLFRRAAEQRRNPLGIFQRQI